MFRLAQVTDPHFRGFAGARPWDFFGKRLLGTMNIALFRRRKHRMELLADLGRDLRERPVDHLAVTGDLGNVSLEGEWHAARAWIEGYGPPDRVTVIPGNHDTYVASVVRAGTFERIFGPYQTAELREDAQTYPFVRLRGDVALVAVNSSVPTGDFGAWGRVGAEQLDRLETLLTAPEVVRRLRVVLLHHPPVRLKRGEDHNLKDRDSLVELLARTGADLVLHGHDHRDERATLEGPKGAKIPVVGAGSASYAAAARYNIYEIEGRAITRVTFGHDGHAFAEVERESLSAGSGSSPGA
jgi:3',5'-cyclic AMP phosphodiesterase CpdA